MKGLPEVTDGSYTPEPWAVETSPHGSMAVVMARVEIDGKPIPYSIARTGQNQGNVRRIVACVNACAGIPTEDLEKLSRLAPYDRLIKLSYLADRQAAPLETSHPDHEYISAGSPA